MRERITPAGMALWGRRPQGLEAPADSGWLDAALERPLFHGCADGRGRADTSAVVPTLRFIPTRGDAIRAFAEGGDHRGLKPRLIPDGSTRPSKGRSSTVVPTVLRATTYTPI